IRRRSDTGQSGEFQLQPDSGFLARVRIVAIDVTPGPEPDTPAARKVLEADETLQFLAMWLLGVAQGIDLPGEHLPAALYGPGGRELELVIPLLHGRRDELLAAIDGFRDELGGGREALIPVGEVDERVGSGLVLHVHRGAFAALMLRVPLDTRVGAPVFERGNRDLRHEIRATGGDGCLPRKCHARDLEVVGLAESSGDELPAA